MRFKIRRDENARGIGRARGARDEKDKRQESADREAEKAATNFRELKKGEIKEGT
jgi:hypothetical protein